MQLKLIREPCPRCGGKQRLEPDPDHGFYAQTCCACGGIAAYVSADQSWTEPTDSETPPHLSKYAQDPVYRPRLVTTEDWVRAELGADALEITETLDAGTYGSYAPEPRYADDLG